MYDKNRCNVVISLQLIKINEKNKKKINIFFSQQKWESKNKISYKNHKDSNFLLISELKYTWLTLLN